MPIKSRWAIPIPDTSFQTWLFKSQSDPLPTTPVFIDANRPDTHFLTLETFRLRSKRYAAGLRAAGLQTGDRVLLFSTNTIFFPVAFIGVLMAGGIFSGANPSYVGRELAYQLGDTGAKFLLVAPGSLDTALDAASMNGFPTENIFIFDDAIFDGKGKSVKGIRHWQELVAGEKEGNAFVWEELDTPEKSNRTAALNYSSGTTGLPKGVEITHKNFVANAAQYIFMQKLDPNYEEKMKKARWLGFLPMYHAMAQAVIITVAPAQGIPVYISAKFDFLKMLENVERFKIDMLTIVPPIVVALAKHPAVRSGKYNLSSVTRIGSGAAPLGKEVINEVEAIWPAAELKISQGWGMTEATCAVTGFNPIENPPSHSVGELNPNCEARFMNMEGTAEVPQGQPGEIWVRGPNIMKGYWRNPKATKETLTEDGWLKTGDIGYYDENGKWYIIDRRKELIKVRGFQVAPAELESVLLDHPNITDAGVVGVTIKGKELPRAYVVLQPGAKTTAAEIAEWMKPRVSRHKYLAGGVVFTDAIPKNPSGKILRKFLRDRAKAEVGDSGEKKTSRL